MVAIVPAVAPLDILSLFERVRFRFVSEKTLQEGIELALTKAGIPFVREKALSERDRPDFMIDESIALEIKTKGSIAQAIRQVNRYTEHHDVSAVVLIGTPQWLSRMPGVIGGKPVFVFRLTESLL